MALEIRLTKEQYGGSLGALYLANPILAILDPITEIAGDWDKIHELADSIYKLSYPEAKAQVTSLIPRPTDGAEALTMHVAMYNLVSMQLARVHSCAICDYFSVVLSVDPQELTDIIFTNPVLSGGELVTNFWEELWSFGAWLFVTSILHQETMLIKAYKRQHKEDDLLQAGHIKAMLDNDTPVEAEVVEVEDGKDVPN